MAEHLELDVDLNDKAFEAAAKKMQTQLDNIAKVATGLQSKLNFKLNDNIVKNFQSSAVNKAFKDLVNPKPIADATRQFKDFRGEINQNANAFKSFTHAFSSFQSLGGALGGLAGGGIGSLIGGGIGTVVDTLIDGAKAFASIIVDGFEEGLKILAGIEQTNLAYKYVTGGGVIGRNITDDLRNNVAEKSPYNSEETKRIALPLYRVFGNDINAVHRAFGAAADLSVFQGNSSPEQTANNAQTIANIQQRGGITARQLTGLGLTNESNKVFFENLGKQWSVSPEQAKKMAQQGGHAEDVLEELYRSIIRQTKQPLGAAAQDAQNTLSAAWHKLLSVPSDVLDDFASDSERFKTASDPITQTLLKLSKDLRETFESPEVTAAISDVLQTLGNSLRELARPETIGNLKNLFLEITKSFQEVFTIENVKTVTDFVNIMIKLISVITGVVGEAGKVASDVGDLDAIKPGTITPQLGKVMNAENIGPTAFLKASNAQKLSYLNDALSKKGITDDENKQLQEQFNLSSTATTPIVTPTTTPTANPINPSSGTPIGINGGQKFELHLTAPISTEIHVNGTSDPVKTGQAHEEEVRKQLANLIERVQQEMGIA